MGVLPTVIPASLFTSASSRAIISYMQTRCSKCGSEMTCQPEGNCWCFELPRISMSSEVESKGCLCRACLLEKIKAAEASSPSGSRKSISPDPRS